MAAAALLHDNIVATNLCNILAGHMAIALAMVTLDVVANHKVFILLDLLADWSEASLNIYYSYVNIRYLHRRRCRRDDVDFFPPVAGGPTDDDDEEQRLASSATDAGR